MNVKPLRRAALPSKYAPDSNAEYTFKNPRRQYFDLPYSIMKYIIENANGSVWKKLIQTCKYFYSKKDLYPVEKFVVFSDESRSIGCTMKIDRKFRHPKSAVPKLWLYNSFKGGNDPDGYPSDVSTVIPKIFKFDLRCLELSFQSLKFEEYQILTASGTIKELNLFYVNIAHSDGTKVTADRLFDNLPNLQKLKCFKYLMKFKSDTVKKMVEILSGLKNLLAIEFEYFDQSFDLSAFSDFLMKNETVFVHFEYLDNEFDDAYQQMIDAFIAKIMENPPKIIPVIKFPGCGDLKFAEYHKMYQLELKWFVN
uniref:DUF38 domain-containing protein n=1 Tax=Panagrolaimus sp. ES5 TaxID=591445 RepID=A0AC34EZ99_9BILA